jgi:phage terminase large subunit-like protein
MPDHAAIANEYARAVVAGEIIACRWIKLACQRHLDDLERVPDSEYPYRFSHKKLNRICKFAELLPLGGRWGGKGNTLKLQPWQCFALSAFGWLRKKDGLRRFRTVYLYVPRKNGKSFLSAVVGLYMLLLDGEQQAEVYCGATTLAQAKKVYDPAAIIIRKTPGLRQMGIKLLADSIIVPTTESKMTVVIGNPLDGDNVSCALLDESHQWPNDLLLSTMQTGMASRLQPLTWVTTTAGYNTAGPAKLMQDDLQDVLLGVKQDDELFGLIHTLDAGDDPYAETSLFKANPNLGVSVYLDYLRSLQQGAKQSPRKRTAFETKHLNLWVASAEGAIDMARWNANADPSLKIEDFEGQECIGAFDLAEKHDLTAYVLLFTKVINEKAHYYLFPRFYLPAARIDDPANGHYVQWKEYGYLESVPGNINTFEELREQILADAKRFQLREVAFDPHHAGVFAAKLGEENITCVEIEQKWQRLSAPMQDFIAFVDEGLIHHAAHPVLSWCAANTEINRYRNGAIMPDKASAEKKIDGTVAAIMALDRATLYNPQPGQWTAEVW